MYRHSPTRNHKSKGFRLKHMLQICVLVAVCFWLIYQVKHSYDKRKQFDENDAKTSRDVEMKNADLKFGRKDLNPQELGPKKDLESHDEEVEEEIVEEDKNEEEIGEEDKHGEESEEEDKHEEESEEEDKQEEETGEEDKNEETGEDKHEEETGEEDKNEEEIEEEDKHKEETGVEDKHEKEEQEEDIEIEEKGVEGRGVGDGGVNEQEQEKTDPNVNQEEEFIDEEKDKEETDEKQMEDKDDGDKDSQQKNDSLIEDHDHDEGSRNTREAREEQYKGDDASSAVTHDGQIASTENVIGSMEHQDTTLEHKNKNNITEDGNTGQYTPDVRELEAARNGNSTSDEEKSSKVLNSFSQGNSSLTSIIALESSGQSETVNNTDTQDSSIIKETEIIMSDSSHAQSVADGNITAAEGNNFETLVKEQSDNSMVALDNTKLDSNSSSSTATKNVEENPVESKDSSTYSKIVSAETFAQSNVSAENKDGSESTTILESTNEVGNKNPENIKGTEGTYETSDSSNTEDTDEVQHSSVDSSDSSVPVDDRENHIDLDTLPDIRTEGSNSEEVSEE